MYTIGIISEIVDSLRERYAISNIIDNLNGTYTVLTGQTYGLQNGDFVTISDTPGFNQSFEISVLIANTSFNITLATGIAIPITFGQWKANAPYFYFSEWKEADRKLMEKGESFVYRFQRFPMIFLLLPITETDSKHLIHDFEIDKLNIYFFTQTDEKKDSIWREINTFPELRILETKFNNQFQKYITTALEKQRTEMFFDTGEKYRFTAPVDTIINEYTNLKVMIPNCTFENYTQTVF